MMECEEVREGSRVCQGGHKARPYAAGTLLLILALAATTPIAQVPATGGAIRGRVTVPDVTASAGRPVVADLGGGTHPPIDRRRVVVYLESAPRQAFTDIQPGRARMDQRGQQFVPHVLAVTAGTVVDFPNNDKTFHNVFSLSRARTFDLGRFAPGRTGSVRFDRPGIVPIFCDIHSHMSAWVLVFGHNYFAVSDDNGRYTIENVPAGGYSLAVWSELGTTPARRVTVTDGAVVEADFRVSREP
jgi:plastocyanin